MKIVLGFSKPNLSDAIGQKIHKEDDATYAFTEADVSKAINKAGRELDFLIVQEDLFTGKYPWDWMSHIKSSVSEKTKVIVLISENTDSLYREIIKRLSIDLGISLIPSALIVDEIADEIANRLYNKPKAADVAEGSRVVSSMSASPKDGATTIAEYRRQLALQCDYLKKEYFLSTSI